MTLLQLNTAPLLLPRPARRDALPEDFTYRDTGCDISPHCLPDYDASGLEIPGTGCPLNECKYIDRPPLFLPIAEAKALRAGGLTVNAVAAHFEVSRRTVFRWCARRA